MKSTTSPVQQIAPSTVGASHKACVVRKKSDDVIFILNIVII